MKNRLFISLALVISLTGCPGSNAVVQPPVPAPSVSPWPSTPPGQLSETLSLLIRDGATKAALPNATVKITSSAGTSKTATTDKFGTVVFTDLIENNVYSIEVQASEYPTKTVSTNNTGIIKRGNTSALTVELFKGLASLGGKITDPDGNPVNSALIKVGNSTAALSDAGGNFKLNLGSAGSFNVKISKTGFNDFSFGNIEIGIDEVKSLGEIKLTRSNETPVVVFDTGKNPFGKGNPVTILSGASDVLKSAGYTVRFENVFSSSLDNIEAIVIVSPSLAYTDAEIKRLSDFVKTGKKLIITGEWGGFGGFNAVPLNKLLNEANLRINPDVLKEVESINFQNTDDHIIASTFVPHFVTQGVNSAAFYGTATVEVISGGINPLDTSLTKPIVLSTSNSFRIQVYNKGQFGLGAISTLGSGKVVVFGDSSFISGDDSNSNGTANIDEANNKALLLNAVKW